MQAILVAPPFENPNYPLYMPSENLGLGYLAASLRHNGYEAEIVDLNMLDLPSQRIADYAKQDFDLVGISVPFQSVVDESLAIAEIARSLWPKAHITLGGHFPTFRSKEILSASQAVDSIVRGDGEDSIVELCEALDRRKQIYFVSGVTFRDQSGRIVENPPRTPRDDLDTLAWPARDTLELIQKLGHPWPTQICSSRGCYASCAFCDIRSFYGRTWRARRPRLVVDEIEWLARVYGSSVFRFTDDEFIGPRPATGEHGPTRAKAIAKEIISRKLSVKLMIDARPEAVDVELFSLLKEAGVIDCLVGVESGVDRILKLYNKGASAARNAHAIETLKSLGISLNLGFIMFDPRMTYEELVTNFSFLKRLDIATMDSLRSWLWPLYGTPVVDQLRAAGLVKEETLGSISYRFSDKRVEEIFRIVTSCAQICRPMERLLYTVKRNGNPDSLPLSYLESGLLALWLKIVESAIADHTAFNYSSIGSELKQIGSCTDY